MIEIILFLLPSFVACLALIAILGYLGIHVLEREIIFIDIALAQVAAVGYTVAFTVFEQGHAHDEGGMTANLFALGATILAAAFFSFVGKRICQISQETVIGVTYAITAAATLFLMALHAGGDVHMEEMLSGSIIWLQWPEIIMNAIVFGAVGVFQFIFRRRFLSLSRNYHCGEDELGFSKFLWDFLFYASMGVVITQSVNIAGLLMTFSLLVMPATFAALFSGKLPVRLVTGWSMATTASVIGLGLAYRYDFSTGPSIVAVMGVLLACAGIMKCRVKPARECTEGESA